MDNTTPLDGREKTSETHLSALSSLGLSQYESRCFLSSLQTGPATINQIGIVAGVPRTKVYGAVRKLVERGLIEQSEEDQKVFIARSPKDVLIPLLEKEQERVRQELDALAELEVIHQSMGFVKRAEALRSKVLRYYPRTGVTRKTRELFLGARKKVVVLTTANGLIRLSKMSEILFDRAKLGMALEIFSSSRDEPVFSTAVQSLKEIENSVISLLPSAAPVQIIIVDEQNLLVSELKPDDLRDDGQDVAFLIHSSELAEMMESLVRVMATVHGELETRRISTTR
ncbi:MAG: TrmB family transcriptional regulator [Nitrososphaerales archaeon]